MTMKAPDTTMGPWIFEQEARDHDEMGGIYTPGKAARVCWFGSSTQYYPSEGEPPTDADGKLMAAAPMLAAVVAKLVEAGETPTLWEEAVAALRAAGWTGEP